MARISIIIPDQLIEKIDDYSDESGYSRSEFIRHLIRKFFIKVEARDNE